MVAAAKKERSAEAVRAADSGETMGMRQPIRITRLSDLMATHERLEAEYGRPAYMCYDDGPVSDHDGPCHPEKEGAYREAFVTEARRFVREWREPTDELAHDPYGEAETAFWLRLRVKRRFTVYAPGLDGPHTHILGYRAGHVVPAARLRGRHHAMCYVTQAWAEFEDAHDGCGDVAVFNSVVLPAWLDAVERWARRPTHPRKIIPPPRPLELEGMEALLPAQPPAEPECTPPWKEQAAKEPADGGGPKLIGCRLSDVKPEPVRWLWPARIATGKLTMIAGDPGLGKSFLTLDIAARVSTGVGWPDAPGEGFEPGDVVLLSAEDDVADTIRPRLDAAGADVSRLVAIEAVRAPNKRGDLTTRPIDLSQDVRYVDALLNTLDNPKLVIVDPISAYMGDTDSHNNAETRAMLAQLADLAGRRSVAVLCVSHLNKGAGRSAVYRVTGSLGFVAAARTVWSVSRDEHDHERRLMLPIKNNLAKDTDGLAYSLHEAESAATPCVAWEDETVAMIADDALNAGDDGGGKTATEEAAEWLRALLADGPIKSADAKSAAEAEGIAARTLDRARKKAGVECVQEREGSKVTGWVWRLASRASGI